MDWWLFFLTYPDPTLPPWVVRHIPGDTTGVSAAEMFITCRCSGKWDCVAVTEPGRSAGGGGGRRRKVLTEQSLVAQIPYIPKKGLALDQLREDHLSPWSILPGKSDFYG